MKTVVIFGGSGFVGQNIIRRLSKTGYRIMVPYQRSSNQAILRLFGSVGQVIPLKFNNLNEALIKKIINDSDVLLNLKTIWQENKSNSYKKNILDFNSQLIDLINLIDKKKPFIFFSGIGASEKSQSLRIRYIYETERYINANLKNSSIIRPSIIIGNGDQFLRKLLPIFKFSFFVPMFGNGEAKLQPVFVDDIAKGIEIILEQGVKNNNIYELTGPEIFTYKTLYKYIAECLNVRRFFLPVPFNLVSFVVLLNEKIHLNILTKDQLLLFKEDNISSNRHKNFVSLRYKQRDLRDIIKKIINN